MLKRIYIFLCLSLFFSADLKGQDYAGKDFWVAFMDIDGCTAIPPPIPVTVALPTFYYDTTEVFLSSEHAATVYINIERGMVGDDGLVNPFKDTIYLTPNKTEHVMFPVQLMCRYAYSDEVGRNGIHIFSDSNIYVQATNKYKNVKGTTSVLPSNSIPYATEYVIGTNEATQQNNCYANMGWNPSTCSEFVIVGIAYNSVIEIYSNSYSLYTGMKPFKPYTIELKQGETFFVVGSAIGGNKIDLSGSIVRSKTPGSKFVVFAGNKKTSSNLRNRNNAICNVSQDHVFEQLYPITSWGKSYSALPFKNNPGGYFTKIVAYESNTNLWINGNFVKTLKASEHYTYNVNSDTASRITSDKAIEVLQFTKGSNCNEIASPKNTFGNLSMMTLASDEQTTTACMVNNTTFLKNWWKMNSNSAPETYVNIICKTADTSFLTYDGKALARSAWKQSSQLKTYSYAQISIDSASHRIKCSKGFKAYVYGYANRQGFSYTAGAGIKAQNNNFIFSGACKGDTTNFTAITYNDSFTNFQWKIGKDPILKNGKTIRYIYPDTGNFNITMYCTHVRTGLIDSVHKRSYSATANTRPVLCNDTLVCGNLGFILACRYLDRYKSYLWNGGHPYYAQYIKNPGLYWVKVTERSGCSYTDSAIVTNAPNPLASFKVSDTLVCSNANHPITFINTSSSKDSLVSILWDFDDFNPIDTAADTLKHFFPKTGQHLVKLKLTTEKSCKHDTSLVVEILRGPKANFSITKFDSCFRNNQIVVSNKTVTDTGFKWYKWYFSEGYILSNADPVGPRKYKKPGKYDIQLIYENNNGCIDTMTKTVTVQEQASAKFITSVAVPCYGDSVHFIVQDSSKLKGVKYKWTFGDLSSDTLKNPCHWYKYKGLYLVNLKAVSQASCNDTFQKSIRLSGTTHADFSINDSSQCVNGNLFNFKNLSSTDTGVIAKYKWRFANNSTDSNYNIKNKTFTNIGKQKVSLIVSNTFNCQDSISKEITLVKSPVAEFEVNDLSQCEDQQNFIFKGKNANTQDTLVYQKWVMETDSFINQETVSNYRFNFGYHEVFYHLRNNKNCSSTVSKFILVNPSPKTKITLADTIACFKQQNILLTNNSFINAGKIKNFIWDFGDQSSSTLQNPLPKKYSSPGNYTITLKSISDSLCRDSNSINVRILPSANIQAITIPTVCLNDSSVFNAINLGGVVDQYKWTFGDQSSGLGQNTKHRYKTIGLHQVSLITNTGPNCKDTFKSSAYVFNLPEVNFRYLIKDAGQDKTVVNFNSLSNTNLKHQWYLNPFGQSIQRDTSIETKDSVGFMAILKVTDGNGCSNTDSQYVFISGPLKFFTPNVFTPNGDGHNEGFGPVGIQFARNYVFTIYSRWGEIIYRSENLNEQWDGRYQEKLCPNGVYIYTIQLMDIYSKNKYFKGSVLLKW